MTDQTQCERSVFLISGPDAREFLQGLISVDLARNKEDLKYGALLTPQGKYLADFFVVPHSDGALIDVHANLAQSLVSRLSMYKLRSKVDIQRSDLCVERGLGPTPDDALSDPRSPEMGWRRYTGLPPTEPEIETATWDKIRVANLIPESLIELIPNETYILETNFEAMGGVDFKKGCYVGQEVTARMKHKTELRKGLARVSVSEPQPIGTPITVDGRDVGTLFTQSQGEGLAYLRFDRAAGEMEAGTATIRRI